MHKRITGRIILTLLTALAALALAALMVSGATPA